MIKYYLATDKQSVFHHGSYDDETQQLTTGQPYLFFYETEEELHKTLDEYGVEYNIQEPELEEPLLEELLLGDE